MTSVIKQHGHTCTISPFEWVVSLIPRLSCVSLGMRLGVVCSHRLLVLYKALWPRYEVASTQENLVNTSHHGLAVDICRWSCLLDFSSMLSRFGKDTLGEAYFIKLDHLLLVYWARTSLTHLQKGEWQDQEKALRQHTIPWFFQIYACWVLAPSSWQGSGFPGPLPHHHMPLQGYCGRGEGGRWWVLHQEICPKRWRS